MLPVYANQLPELSPLLSMDNVNYYTKEARKRQVNGIMKIWNNWDCPIDKRKTVIDYLTIPADYRAAKGLPPVNQVKERLKEIQTKKEAKLYEEAQRKKEFIEYRTNEKKADKETEISNLLYAAFNDLWHGYRNIIKDTFPGLSNEKCLEFAKKTAVIKSIVYSYERSRYCLEATTKVYYQLFPTGRDITPAAKHAFSNKLRELFELRERGALTDADIINVAVDKRAVVKVQNRRSVLQMAFLQMLFIQKRKPTVKEAFTKLQEYCNAIAERAMSEANIKIIYREFKNNPELFKARYGEGAAQKQLPYLSLLAAEHRNTQWQIDGWTMPFWGAEFQRYTLYLIRDNHSRKILGYSIATSENTALILEGLETAMRNTGVFPGELVSDKHSFHKTTIATRLKTETERMGAVWTVTINAQRNQLAERYNQYLDALCRDFEGYLGKNITATGKDARPSPETLAEYAKTANFKTEAEIRAIAAYIVQQFNDTPLEPIGNLSPNEKYNASEDLKAFKVSDTAILQLVRPIAEYKVTRGQIIIKVGIQKHEFQLPAELIARYNNRIVNVVYEDLTDGIYISDIKTGEELGCILPKRKVHGAIPDQTEADKKLLNQATGRKSGTETKGRKAAQKRIIDGLALNPEAIDLINTYALPKDIRQTAMQDAALKRQLAIDGVNVDAMPIRAIKSNETALPITKQGRTKESPFAPAKNEIKRLTIDELMQQISQQ